MSLPLLKATWKRSWLLLVTFCVVLFFYAAVMISMYDPDSLQTFSEMLKLLPESLVNALGFGQVSADLSGYVAGTLYGFIMVAFPMIYSIILANQLIAKPVDQGSMVYFLSTPASRTKIVLTQGIYGLLSLVLLFIVVFGSGSAVCGALFPGRLEISAFLRVNVITMLVSMTVFMICFFFSCLFNDTKKALGFGCAVPIVFFLMSMLADSAAALVPLGRYSIFGWYDPVTVAHDGIPPLPVLAYLAIIAALFIGSALIFKKKRLPL